MLGTDQPLKHLVAVLDAMPTAPSPPTAMPYPRMNAISATPSALAQQIGFVWTQNSKAMLVRKNTQEQDTAGAGQVRSLNTQEHDTLPPRAPD